MLGCGDIATIHHAGAFGGPVAEEVIGCLFNLWGDGQDGDVCLLDVADEFNCSLLRVAVAQDGSCLCDDPIGGDKALLLGFDALINGMDAGMQGIGWQYYPHKRIAIY